MYHPSMALVEVNAVWKSYPRRAGLRTVERPVVEDVTLSLSMGETLGLVETGEAEALCAHPKEEYTRQLIAATPELPATADRPAGMA
jgi:ABC-type oligopeptide transport system ATPase subunit